MSRIERITRADGPPTALLAPGVEMRLLAGGELGAEGLTTALAAFAPGGQLPYHRHPCSEVVVVVAGEAHMLVEGRRYRLGPHDAVHLPAGTAHSVENPFSEPAVLHSSFASAAPGRELLEAEFRVTDHDCPPGGAPEGLVRFAEAPVYELAPQAFFRDLFARRLGARGICGGYGVFEPGASLPCHYHAYDESITIVAGSATCQVAGREYALSDCATACIPTGRPHRFLNRSSAAMAMIWVYAGDEPERTLVDPGYCEGTLVLTP